MNRVFSAFQPTSVPHIGNLFSGVIEPYFLNLGMFAIADLHALTTCLDQESVFKTTKFLMALKIHKNTILFRQSAVPQHTKLMWILSCLCSTQRLDRMTQWKSKKQKNSGLYTYPILQAADVLLYRPSLVPVGEDQLQHLELARVLARKFNSHYKTDFLIEPQYQKCSNRIMSLTDPKQKMSKSDSNPKSRIQINDENDVIAMKIKQAVTDENGVQNLIQIYKLAKGKEELDPTKNEKLKQTLTDALISIIEPIRKEMNLISNEEALHELQEGELKAMEIATSNWNVISNLVGIK